MKANSKEVKGIKRNQKNAIRNIGRSQESEQSERKKLAGKDMKS